MTTAVSRHQHRPAPARVPERSAGAHEARPLEEADLEDTGGRALAGSPRSLISPRVSTPEWQDQDSLRELA